MLYIGFDRFHTVFYHLFSFFRILNSNQRNDNHNNNNNNNNIKHMQEEAP